MKMYIIIAVAVLILTGGFIIYCKVKKLKVKEAISLFMDIVEKIIGSGNGDKKITLLKELFFLWLKTQVKSKWILAIIKIFFSTKEVEKIVNTDINVKQATGTYNNTFDLSDFDFKKLDKKNYVELYAENELKDFLNENKARIGVTLGRKF